MIRVTAGLTNSIPLEKFKSFLKKEAKSNITQKNKKKCSGRRMTIIVPIEKTTSVQIYRASNN